MWRWLIGGVCLGSLLASAAGDELAAWPRWRGLTGQGVVTDERTVVSLPEPWPAETPKPVWEFAVGEGWSSPVIDGRTVLITERRSDKERVVALDAATGRERWARENPVAFDPHPVGRRHGNGPKSTPVMVGSQAYTLGIAGWLQAVNLADGAVLWRHHLPAEYGRIEPMPGTGSRVIREQHVLVPVGGEQGAPVPLFGYTGSLLALGERLIVPVGGERGGTIMAFDLTTGREVWRSLRENVSYSSPIAVNIAGQEQIVVMTGPRVVGLDPTDGKLLWSYPFQVQYDESIGTPVVAGDLVMVQATGRPLTALRLSRTGQRWDATFAWDNFDVESYLSSMAVREGHLYGKSDSGEFHCVRLNDGKTVWSGGRHGYYCTPILAGRRLLSLNERGLLFVVAAEPTAYQELGRSQLGDGECWTSPALVGSRLYVRSARSVRCFDFDRSKAK